MNILGWILAWCVSGVSSVTEDFGVEISKELSFRYAVVGALDGFGPVVIVAAL